MENKHYILCLFLICGLAWVLYSLIFSTGLQYWNHQPRRPNIVLILTDDQDSVLGGFDHMKNVQDLVVKNGHSFVNSYVTTPLCCPSRSSILTGRYVHNHMAINNSLNGGCSSRSWQKSHETKTFPVALHQNGYRTFFAGKYLNQYGRAEAGGLKHIPPGWDWWIGLAGNSRYYNYSLSVNGTREAHGDNPAKDYLPHVIREKALEFLDNIHSGTQDPFFMMLSTPSCHAPFTAEPKYQSHFTGVQAPRTPSFNIKNDNTKHWLLRHGEQPLREGIVRRIDEIYRSRLRTLLTVDDMVADIYHTLASKSLLESTYIIFTSDNGYHLGQFSMPIDKREPYEFDIKVPLVISGPGITHGSSPHLVSNIDLAPSILDLAGLSIPRKIDGSSWKHSFVSDMNEHKQDEYSIPIRKTILIEHYGEATNTHVGCEHQGPNLGQCNPEFDCKCSDARNNTYACLRHLSETDNYLYCKWQDQESFEEYYNLAQDSAQLNNTAHFISTRFKAKLGILLKKYRKCRGQHCTRLSKFVA